RDRFDVSAIGELGIGHDRGRIRIHEDDVVAFFAQRLASLDAGIIELAALPDDDRTRANQQNLVEIVVPRHWSERTIDEFTRRSRAKRPAFCACFATSEGNYSTTSELVIRPSAYSPRRAILPDAS